MKKLTNFLFGMATFGALNLGILDSKAQVFDKIEYFDERVEESPHGKYWDGGSVNARVFINENLQAGMDFRDVNNDGKFDEIDLYIHKNDFIFLSETIQLDEDKEKTHIKRYISGKTYFFPNHRNRHAIYEPDYIVKDIKNKPLEEIALADQKRISEILNLKIGKESVIDFLTKETKEKSDLFNPSSPNSLYNQMEKISKIPGGLDKIAINSGENDEMDHAYFERVCDSLKVNPDFPPRIRTVGSKKGLDYVFVESSFSNNSYYCEILKGEREKGHYFFEVYNFTKNHQVIHEFIFKGDPPNPAISFSRKIYDINKKGEAKELKDNPDAVEVKITRLKSDFSEKDLERVKKMMNSERNSSILKDFVKANYETYNH